MFARGRAQVERGATPPLFGGASTKPTLTAMSKPERLLNLKKLQQEASSPVSSTGVTPVLPNDAPGSDGGDGAATASSGSRSWLVAIAVGLVIVGLGYMFWRDLRRHCQSEELLFWGIFHLPPGMRHAIGGGGGGPVPAAGSESEHIPKQQQGRRGGTAAKAAPKKAAKIDIFDREDPNFTPL